MLRTLLACAALAALLPLRGGSALAASVPATIQGAEVVNVRRGPGLDTPAFVTLHRGTAVRAEERVGQWVRVVLESGRRGYINAAFVEPAPGATVPAAAPTEAATDTPLPADTPEPTATIIAAPPPAIDRELAALRERVASLEASLTQSHRGAGVGVHSEGAAQPPEGAAQPPPAAVPGMVEPPVSLDVGPSLALAGVGLLVGFLFGTLYGQRQERNRRTRVRF